MAEVQGLLAVRESMRHFRHFLEGHDFYALTDHKLLTAVLFNNCSSCTATTLTIGLHVGLLTSDLLHVQGSANQAADTVCSCHLTFPLSYSERADFYHLLLDCTPVPPISEYFNDLQELF